MKDDIILDCSNEYWRNTERRQESLEPDGIHYIGCGVSGGYQSARHGPSMSPGGDAETLKSIMPLLEQVAAKDNQGRPCVTPIGPAGSGHYVKMVHNGIEQGMLSAIAELWSIMNKNLGMSYAEIGDTFDAWDKSDPLRDNFLVSIGADINRTQDEKGKFVLASVLDKVVQDADDTEGTGIWTCEEAIRLHVPAPTILAAHQFRVASANAGKRERTNRALKTQGAVANPSPIKLESPHDKVLPAFIEDLRQSLYAAFLCAFIQGFDLIKTMDREQNWKLDYKSIIQIWRGGCIIQSDYISDVLDSVLSTSDHPNEIVDDLLAQDKIASELGKCCLSLKNVVIKAIEVDGYVPALSATLEYLKYSGSRELPTQFMEAELDYFGHHNFDYRSEGPGSAVKGKHHYEWKPATGIFGNRMDGTKG
jgi:6-phosphogluconate dehydrogenase